MRFVESADWQVVALPYRDMEWDMIVVLPAEGRGAAFEQDAAGALDAAADGMESVEVDLTFPKFRFRWSGSLVGTLKALGMERAFDDRADFSALADLVLDVVIGFAGRAVFGGDGLAPPPGFAVVGYGKLGGKELGCGSDLDIVFLYDESRKDEAEKLARVAQRVNTCDLYPCGWSDHAGHRIFASQIVERLHILN